MRRVGLIANSIWNIVNFRGNLVRSLEGAGYGVVVLAPREGDLRSPGTEFFHLPVKARSANPVVDLLLMLRLIRLLRKTKLDVVLNFTIKPVVYGTLSARVLGIPCVNNITGLGTLFLKGAAWRTVGLILYGLVLRLSNAIFFQNPDDLDLFSRHGFLRRPKVGTLPGSGVDLTRFSPARQVRRSNGAVVILFVGRLLLEKGIEDFVDAARIVRRECGRVRFQVLGSFEPREGGSALRSKVMLSIEDRTIEYLGSAADVRPHVAQADCVVLPSYREGTPRSLLEAAAMQRPIITTDVPGCREVVERGKNGYLCRPRDPEDLARKVMQFVGLSVRERARMGRLGRRKMERQFDEGLVIDKYLSVVKELAARR